MDFPPPSCGPSDRSHRDNAMAQNFWQQPGPNWARVAATLLTAILHQQDVAIVDALSVEAPVSSFLPRRALALSRGANSVVNTFLHITWVNGSISFVFFTSRTLL